MDTTVACKELIGPSFIHQGLCTIYVSDHSDPKMSGYSFCSFSFCCRLKGRRGKLDNCLHIQNDYSCDKGLCSGQWRDVLSLKRSEKASVRRRSLNWVLKYGLESTQGPSHCRNFSVIAITKTYWIKWMVMIKE